MKTLLLLTALAVSVAGFSQPAIYQYFDGNDTIPWQTLNVEIDTTTDSIWQIGHPHKFLLNDAYSQPNVIMTDTIDKLPDHTLGSFKFTFDAQNYQGSLLAIQWAQKLDLDTNTEVGIIEYSIDTGQTWVNVVNEPLVYSYYGFQSGNQGAHHIYGDEGFTGQDTVWRDIWLCFHWDFLWNIDTLEFKYTIKTDTIQHNSEGWMMDNFSVHTTWTHTITENSRQEAFKSYPTATSDIVHVSWKKSDNPPIIKTVEIIDLAGRVVDKFSPTSLNFDYDISRQTNGSYKMKIITDQGFDICPIIVQH